MMRSFALALTCLIGSFFGTAAAHAPHDVATVVALSPDFANDGVVFARMRLTTHLLFARSSDRGRSWDLVGEQMLTSDVLEFVFSPDFANDQTAFAATTKQGVYKTTDGGFTWTPTNGGLTELSIKDIVVSPDFATDGTVLVATPSGAFRSDDRGASWTSVNTGLTNINVTKLSATDDPLVYFAGFQTLFRSDDGGFTWTPLATYPGAAMASIEASPTYSLDQTVLLCFGRFGGGIEVSTDSGVSSSPVVLDDMFVNKVTYTPTGSLIAVTRTDGCYIAPSIAGPWTLSNTGFEQLTDQTVDHYLDVAVSPDYANDGTVFVAAYEGLHHSTDFAQSWLQNDVYSQLINKRVRFSPQYATTGEIFFGNYGGGVYVYREPWAASQASRELEASIAISGSTGIVTPNSGIVAPNNGTVAPTWLARTKDVSTPYCIALTLSPNFADDRTLAYGFAGMWRSIAAGEAWSSIDLPEGITIIRDVAYSPHFDTDMTVFASTSKEPQLRSVDGGVTWAPLTGGLPASLRIEALDVSPDFTNDGIVLMAGSPDGMWRSSDGGDTWNPANDGLTTSTLRTVAMSPDFAKSSLALLGTVDEGLFRSTDGGVTWTPSNGGLPDDEVLTVESIAFSPDVASDGTVYVVLLTQGVWKSADFGATWQPVGPGLPPCAARVVSLSPNFSNDETLIVSTYDWVWISRDAGSAWTRLPGFQRVDDLHGAVLPVSAGWIKQPAVDTLTGKISASNTVDAHRALTFRGHSIAWHAQRDNASGEADVFIDGALAATIDLYASTTRPSEPVFEMTFDSVDWHTIEIRVTGTAAPRSSDTTVRSDGFSYSF